ncbi:MAG TPA: hypothetical protein VJ440_02385 [Candidatus Brocadiaceae bacterium]|nr:hypothetical protein [Candidatus Brocadiaceae bacterium]
MAVRKDEYFERNRSIFVPPIPDSRKWMDGFRPINNLFSPPLRGGENPGGNSPDCLTPPLRSGENQAVKIDTPLRGGDLPPGLVEITK